MARAPDPELRSRSDAELLEVATSKNYGKSTREGARQILAERGVKLDDATFANPSAGFVPDKPGKGENSRTLIRILSFILFVIMLTAAKLMFRY